MPKFVVEEGYLPTFVYGLVVRALAERCGLTDDDLHRIEEELARTPEWESHIFWDTDAR